MSQFKVGEMVIRNQIDGDKKEVIIVYSESDGIITDTAEQFNWFGVNRYKHIDDYAVLRSL